IGLISYRFIQNIPKYGHVLRSCNIMRIIQFSCAVPEVAEQHIAIMVRQANLWSRFSWLTTDPEYVTQPFGADVWHTHTTQTDLYWSNWDAVYDSLGNDGREVADQFLKPGDLTGILLDKALLPDFPDII